MRASVRMMSRAPTAREDEIQAASSSHVGSWCGKISAPRRPPHPARVARRSVRPSSVLPWRAALHDRPSRRVGVARRVVDLLRCSTSPALHSAQPPADKSVVESSACAHRRTRRLGPSITRTPAHACPTIEPRICLPQLASSGHLVVSPCILVFLVRLHRLLEHVLLLDERLEGRARAHLRHVDSSCAGARAASGACACDVVVRARTRLRSP